jgi:pyridoxal phosphate enzyme (YggS family)
MAETKGYLMIAATLTEMNSTIARAAKADGRNAEAVTLVAVSKKQPDDRIDDALEVGLRVFGENRVQEAQARWQDRRLAYDDLCLHLIGPLQTNKSAEAVALFDVIESVDREKLAASLAREMEKQNLHRQCYVQVNTGDEGHKAGLSPLDVVDFVETCRMTYGLNITGLMCIPPIDEEPAMHFALLKRLAAEAGVEHLSMGMSNDYDIAIRFGATHIRVGSGLFGSRLDAI